MQYELLSAVILESITKMLYQGNLVEFVFILLTNF